MSTAPQREPSETHKMSRGLREHMLDLDKTLRKPRRRTLENLKRNFLPRSQPLFVKVYKVLRLPRQMRPRHPKCCTCHTESASCPKSNSSDFRTFQNIVQVHHILHLPRKITSKISSQFDPCLPTLEQGAISAAPHERKMRPPGMKTMAPWHHGLDTFKCGHAVWRKKETLGCHDETGNIC